MQVRAGGILQREKEVNCYKESEWEFKGKERSAMSALCKFTAFPCSRIFFSP